MRIFSYETTALYVYITHIAVISVRSVYLDTFARSQALSRKSRIYCKVSVIHGEGASPNVRVCSGAKVSNKSIIIIRNILTI